MSDGSGLAQHWGLDEPKGGGSDKQAKDFKKEFTKKLEVVADALVDLAGTAADGATDAVQDQRDKAYKAYQKVVKKIDPTDPKKVEKDVEKVIDFVKGIGNEAVKVKDAVEDALQNWLALRDAVYDEILDRLNEMEALSEAVAKALLKKLAEVDELTGRRDWEAATKALRDLKSAVDAAYEEFQQKRDQFLDARDEVKDRLMDAGAAIADTLKDGLDATLELADKGIETATGGDIDLGLGELLDAADATEDLETDIADLKAKKEAYEKRLAAIDPRAQAVIATTWPQIIKIAASVAQKLADAATAATAEDYDQAMTILDFTEAQIVGLEAAMVNLEAEKKQYEAAKPGPLGRLETAGAPIEDGRAQGMQMEMTAKRDVMLAKESLQDYQAALVALGELETLLAEFEPYRAEVEALIESYKARAAELAPLKKEAVALTWPQLADQIAGLETIQGYADSAASGFDYHSAIGELDDMAAEIDSIKAAAAQFEEIKATYDGKKPEIMKRVATALEPLKFEKAQKRQEGLAAARDEMESVEKDQDYAEALNKLGVTEHYLVGLETYRADMEAERQEYDSRLSAIKERLETAAEEPPYQEAKGLHGRIAELRGEMEAAAEQEDFDAALRQMDLIEANLASYEKQIEIHQALAEEYERRAAALEPRFKAAAETVANKILLNLQSLILRRQEAMAEAAETGDYEAANGHADWHEVTLASYETYKADVDAERVEYESRKAALKPKLDALSEEPANTEANNHRLTLIEHQEDMEDAALRDDFDAALAVCDRFEAACERYVALLREARVEEEKYKARMGSLEDRLMQAIAPAKHKELRALRDAVMESQSEVEAQAGSGEFQDANTALDALEPMLAGYEALKSELKNAEENYTKRFDAIKAGLKAAAEGTPYHSVKRWQAEIAEDEAAVLEKAAADDFEAALIAVVSLAGKLARYQSLADIAKSKEVQFNALYPEVIGRMKAVEGETGDEHLVALLDNAKTERDALEKTRGWLEFASALDGLVSLQGQLDEIEAYITDREAERQAYEKRYGVIRPRLDAAEPKPPYEKTAIVHGALRERIEAMFSAAGEDKYDAALGLMDEVEALLADYEKSLEIAQGHEAEYNKRMPALEPKIAAALTLTENEKLKGLQEKIQAQVTRLDENIAANNFEEALQALNFIEPATEAYATHQADVETEREELARRMATLEPRAKPALEVEWKQMTGYKEAITTILSEIEGASTKEDFDEALARADSLERNLDAFETANERFVGMKAEYDDRFPAIEKQFDLYYERTDYPDDQVGEFYGQVLDTYNAMVEAENQTDYEGAMAGINKLDRDLPKLKNLVEAMDAKVEAYDTRFEEVEPMVIEAEETDWPQLSDEVKEIARLMEEADKRALGGDHDKALGVLERVASKFEGFKAEAGRLEQAQNDFEKVEPAMLKRVTTVMATDHPKTKKTKTEINGLIKGIETLKADKDFTTASERMDLVEYYVAILEGFQETEAGAP